MRRLCCYVTLLYPALTAGAQKRRRLDTMQCSYCHHFFTGVSGLNNHIQSTCSCKQKQFEKALQVAQQDAAAAPAPPIAVPAARYSGPRLFSDPEESDSDAQPQNFRASPEPPHSEVLQEQQRDEFRVSPARPSLERHHHARLVSEPLLDMHPSHQYVQPAAQRDPTPNMTYLLKNNAALEISHLLLNTKTRDWHLLLKHVDPVAKDLSFSTAEQFNQWLLPEKVSREPLV